MKQYQIHDRNRYNTDEKGFLQGVIKEAKHVVSIKQLRQGKIKGALQTGSRDWITVIACICQDGTYQPPAIIFQGHGNLQTSWVQDFDRKRHICCMTSTPSGFTNEKLAMEWLTKIWDPATRAKANDGKDWRLIWLDGHNSHVSLQFLEWCGNNRVLIAVFPPHSTHRLQPLDVSLFCPLAIRYSQNLENWIQTTGGSFNSSQRDFLGLFWPAFERSFTRKNILSGWAKTGLAPFKPDVVLDQVKPPSRPTSSESSGSSAFSAGDWRRMRRLIRTEVSAAVNDKLLLSFERVSAENALLKHQLDQANQKIKIQAKRAPRGKPLFEQVRAEGEQQAMFASPSKIQRVIQVHHERELEEAAKQAEKEERAAQRVINKEMKEQAMEERKIEREKKRTERLEAEAAKKAAKELAREQKEAVKKAQLESKNSQKRPRSKPRKSGLTERPSKIGEAAVEDEVAETKATSIGRQPKLPARFQNE
jgi:hypothetical protein